ncbi:MAG: 3-isopropylmalate dehydratase [Candidatus Coatesbacteria bacterium]|nr:3-isopropylmalate dehydratase [Candidatus Coatesbacteria bacterium]
MHITGRACFIKNASGALIDNIDTDMIFHNAHLHVTDIAQMAQYAFGNLSGWEKFPESASNYDILVVGGNFGAGSSRQQAVDCFIASGIKAILAESFAPIYFRNAINSGMAVLTLEGAQEGARQTLEEIPDGAELSVNLKTGEVAIGGKKGVISCPPIPPVLLSIIEAGGLFEFAKKTSK